MAPAPVGLLEQVGSELEIGAVLLPSGEFVGSLVELAGPMDCDRLNAELVGGRPNVPCLLYTSPSPRDGLLSRMPSSA